MTKRSTYEVGYDEARAYLKYHPRMTMSEALAIGQARATNYSRPKTRADYNNGWTAGCANWYENYGAEQKKKEEERRKQEQAWEDLRREWHRQRQNFYSSFNSSTNANPRADETVEGSKYNRQAIINKVNALRANAKSFKEMGNTAAFESYNNKAREMVMKYKLRQSEYV